MNLVDEANGVARRLETLEVGQSLFADLVNLPLVIRARDMLGVQLPERSARRLGEPERRPFVAAEVEVVRDL